VIAFTTGDSQPRYLFDAIYVQARLQAVYDVGGTGVMVDGLTETRENNPRGSLMLLLWFALLLSIGRPFRLNV